MPGSTLSRDVQETRRADAISFGTAAASFTPGLVSVLVAVYNEAAMIQRLIAAIRASPVSKEIVVIDDGSTDGTREVLAALRPADDLALVFHERRHGKGAAIRSGLRYARGEFVIIQDADLEYDPRDFPALLAPLLQGETNVAYGVRPDRPDRGALFFQGAKLLTRLTNTLYRSSIHDEATCYKAFRRSVLMTVPLTCRGFEFCPEVTAKLLRRGEKIAEVPISYTPRTRAEGKKVRAVDGLIAIWTLARWRFAPRADLLRDGALDPAPPFAVAWTRLPKER